RKSNAQIEREALEGFVVEAFERRKGRYGYRRINRELRKSGIAVSEKRVLRIMQKFGPAGKGAARKRRIQKKAEPGDPRLNLAERAFTAGGRNRLWAGGIACMPAREGWLYLAAATGAFSRKVVGWSMSGRIAGKVAIDAIERAVGREDPPDDGGLVFHDGQGAQYTSRSFQRCLDPHGIVQSASRPGTPPGNAAAEPFFKTPKGESAEEGSHGTRDGAKRDIFKRIGLYCNRVRMHSALDCMPPVEYERQYA
ncbi:MAG: IS3 family transposase, partial [Slackia sp.]|nr:IS3 family transposase [Slackia sp.]